MKHRSDFTQLVIVVVGTVSILVLIIALIIVVFS